MLVLSRKTGQKLVIGEDIRVIVVGTDGSRVLLGIEAPHHQRILRGELLNRPEEPLIVEVPPQVPERIPSP